MIYTSF
jgi:hypothetical protein